MKPALSKCLIVFFIYMPFVNQILFGADAQINTNWLAFSMKFAKTNFNLGDKIPVSIIVSNIYDEMHPISWFAGDPCNYGLGEIEITHDNSKVPCRLGKNVRAQSIHYYLTYLYGHTSKTFYIDLAAGYYMTNSGNYTIYAAGWFPQSGTATNHQHMIVNTPTLIISLSPQLEINVPQK